MIYLISRVFWPGLFKMFWSIVDIIDMIHQITSGTLACDYTQNPEKDFN